MVFLIKQSMSKYKYYFRKPRTEIAKDVIKWILLAGMVTIAGTSPSFGVHAWRAFQKQQRQEKYQKRKFTSVFTRLKRRGLLNIEQRGHDTYVSLTPRGKELAGYMQIDALEIKRPKQWDKKWRFVLFDIIQPKKMERNAFRAKLRELGFLPYQKSVWIHPCSCKDEIELLKNFFGLDNKEVSVVVAEHIEAEGYWKRRFKLD